MFFSSFDIKNNNVKNSESSEINVVCIIWQQYGPYHISRLEAVREKLPSKDVFGIEISSNTKTYGWIRSKSCINYVHSLLNSEVAERVSFIRVFFKALVIFRQRGVQLAFIPSYWPSSSVAFILAAKITGSKIIMMNDSHAHTSRATGLKAFIKKRLVLMFDGALVAGHPHQEYFSKLGMPINNIVLGYDVVNNEHFISKSRYNKLNKSSLTIKYGLPKKYILNVGRMVEKKNLSILIEAYKIMRLNIPNIYPKLVFVGDGVCKDELVNLCLKYSMNIWQEEYNSVNLDKDIDVYFYNFKQIEELTIFYSLASIFVLPSKYEEWGLVVNEAMASGIPVVVSETAGCAYDLVQNYITGIKFNPLNADELEQHLTNLVCNEELSKTLTLNGQKHIAKWGLNRFAEGVCDAIKIVAK